MGIPVYDCDSKAKLLMHQCPMLRQALTEAIGQKAYTSDGTVNRKYMAAYIFENPEHTETVNRIVHPTVRTDFNEWAHRTKSTIVAVESAILHEAQIDADTDIILLIQTPIEQRIRNTIQRDNTDEASVRLRMKSQSSDEQFQTRATHIIYNDGRYSLIKQLEELLSKLAKGKTFHQKDKQKGL